MTSKTPPRLDYQSLWQSTLIFARNYYGGSFEAHNRAAKDVTVANNLSGHNLILWTEFVNRKLTRIR